MTATLVMTLCLLHSADKAPAPQLEWKELAPLPDRIGFAGMYAGVSGGALIAAGGANFPGKPIWENGTKVWYDTIYVLDRPDGKWQVAKDKLPRPLGYGVSVNHDDALLCIGGGDAERHYTEVVALRWKNGRIEREPWPSIPKPAAHHCGAIVGKTIFVAGGLETPSATEAMRNFWALDLSVPLPKRRWQELSSWPGPERHQAVVASLKGSLFLFSGIRLIKDDAGKPLRVFPYLEDAYRFDPVAADPGVVAPISGKWARLADMPKGTAAAPNPAVSLEPSSIVILGGIDGSAGAADPRTFPAFPDTTLVYDVESNAWKNGEPMPAGSSRVTVPSTVWNDGWVVVSGENAPSRRSPKVYFVKRK